MSQPRPDLVAQLPNLIAQKVTGIIPGLAQCEGITGRFDAERLKRAGIQAPAVLVSLMGLRQGQGYAGHVQTYVADFAAFVVTKDAVGLKRHEAGGAIVQALLRLIPDNNWGQIGVGYAEGVQATSLNNEALDKQGVALWGISWTQTVMLQGYEIPLPLPIALYLGMDPGIGPGNEDEYTQITGATP
jgi:hypothetical protein